MSEGSSVPRRSGEEPPTCRVRPVTRRRFVGAATGAFAAPALAGKIAAQEELNATPELGTPVASPAAVVSIDVDALHALSQTLVGGGELNQNAVEPLAQLIGGDEELVAGFEELVQFDDPASAEARERMSGSASATVSAILHYWYRGYFDGQPVENRADIFFGLPAWSAVPYFTQPTLCKGFGYWATDVQIESDSTPEAGS